MKKINIDNFMESNANCLVSQELGEKFFNTYLEEINSDEQIEFVIPERIVVMNKSFFLGAFDSIIEKIGKDKFLKRIHFSNPDIFIYGISYYVDFVLNRQFLQNSIKMSLDTKI